MDRQFRHKLQFTWLNIESNAELVTRLSALDAECNLTMLERTVLNSRDMQKQENADSVMQS